MKRPKKLSATFVKSINKSGRYGDGRGGFGLTLLLKPMANGRLSKTWAQRLRINGRPTNIGLGRYPVVNLAEARARALENIRAITQGKDPRVSDSIPTFTEAAEKVIEIHSAGWKDSGKSEKQWRASLTTYVYPKLGKRSVSDITTADVMSVLLPIWNDKRETARRIRQRISAIMKWSIAQNYRTDDPAANVTQALPKNSTQVKHMEALPYSEVAGAIKKIWESQASTAAKLAFEFLVLTACRSGEVRGARWDEINLEGAVWTVLASRMKAKKEHRVPLSKEAMAILEKAGEIADKGGLLFPSPTGRTFSDSTLSKLIRENGINATVHGMRSSFRDWASEQTNTPRAVMEAALAHVIKDRAEAAYARSDLFNRRKDLMAQWGSYISGGLYNE